MARKSNAAKKQESIEAQNKGEQAVSAAPGLFVLKKSHGLTHHGRTHKFYAAGTTFDPAKDGELISLLFQSGALIEEAAAEVEPVEESTEPTGDVKPEDEGQPEGDQFGTQE